MTKTQYYTATSIDGFIADADNSLDWLFEAASNGIEDTRFGRSYGDAPCWVFTHRNLPPVPAATLSFVQGDVGAVHERMVAAADGRNIWLVGGGDLVGQFADQGLLDEILLGIAPVMLGAGAQLLPRRLGAGRLTLQGVEHDERFVFLTYRVGHG